MEPRIQYVETSDGVSITYWAMGGGEPPILMRPETTSHLVNELAIPEIRGFYDLLFADIADFTVSDGA